VAWLLSESTDATSTLSALTGFVVLLAVGVFLYGVACAVHVAIGRYMQNLTDLSSGSVASPETTEWYNASRRSVLMFQIGVGIAALAVFLQILRNASGTPRFSSTS